MEKWIYPTIESAHEALKFVKKEKDNFADSTRCSIISGIKPYVIKEIIKYDNTRITWVWVFTENICTIYVFEGVPKKSQIKEIIRDSNNNHRDECE